ncbi:VIT domain-containing protein [Pseudoxanthomonas wuyuanensis]|nr:VIT domain-containing protein [Pseudoxanthomonas wuyuanensis]
MAAASLSGAQDLTAPRLPPLLEVHDGESPVTLRTADVDATVFGSLAQTTVELVFYNPNNRPLEGQLNFPLRDGQRITGFALDFEGRMRPAVPVEKAKGQQVFEAIERRQVDPALLEQTAGNHFKLRIFPIPARGSRRVRLQYSESLTQRGRISRLSLPLDFARGADSLSLRLEVRGQTEKPVAEDTLGALAFERDGDGWSAESRFAKFRVGELAVDLPRTLEPRVYTQRIDGQVYFLAEVPADEGSAQRRLPKKMGLLWDSSASARRRDFGSESAVLDAYFKAAGDIEVSLIRLRDRAEPAVTFQVRGGDWRAIKSALRETIYDGASNLGDWQPQSGTDEYLLFSDGLSNYGAQAFPALPSGQRLYTLHTAGAHADGQRLRAWAEGNGGESIAFDAEGVPVAVKRLLSERPRLLSHDLAGGEDLVYESAVPRDGVFRIAGKLRALSGALRVEYRHADGRLRTLELPIDARHAAQGGPIGQLWAAYWVDGLSGDGEANRARIRRLGQQFGLVTAETSLIVLETVEDYVRYDIAPPAGWEAQFAALKSADDRQKSESAHERLDWVAEAFEEKIAWWHNRWPKGPPQRLLDKAVAATGAEFASSPPPALAAPAPSISSPQAAGDAYRLREQAAASQQGTLDSIVVTGTRLAEEDRQESPANSGAIRIALQAWQPESPYGRRLREAAADRVYALYLDERDSYADSVAFYLDVTDVLFEKGQDDLALRVLSNLAEMELENRHILRVLAYRLMQARQPVLAVPVFEKVKRLAEEEPQSFRDLGLAYAAVGRTQPAIEQLYEVVKRDWDDRFDGVTLIALAELNAIIANARQRPDTRALDPRLLKNLPLDLRVVLSWDSDNSDMDLWVTDPNDEKCYYGNSLTYQGGRLSDDFTGGYGPEEFSLRDAKPGKYKVEANFFGDQQQLVTGATTLQLKLTTHFGTAKAQEQLVTMRLKEESETVLVGEFEVK